MLAWRMADYEFRFFRDDSLVALHVTVVENDAEACERARKYLEGGAEFDWVEVRRGFRFMQKIWPDVPMPENLAGSGVTSSRQ
jgi:hypothetical protein